MNRNAKSLLAIGVVLALTLSLVFAVPATSSAATKGSIDTAINDILKVYPNGSCFTKDKRTPCDRTTKTEMVYRYFNRCIGFVKYATARIYGTNEVGYNFEWNNKVYFDEIGSAPANNANAMAALLNKAKKGDIITVTNKKESSTSEVQHAMIFLYADGSLVFVYHCNWDRHCGIVYDDPIDFSRNDRYRDATMTIYHSKNYEYLYGEYGDGRDGESGPVPKPTIKPDSKITIKKVDSPYRSEIGVRMKITNPTHLHLEKYGIQYRKSGTSAWKTYKNVSLNEYGVSYGVSGSGLYIKVAGLKPNTKYQFRAVLKVDGMTVYSPIKGIYKTKK